MTALPSTGVFRGRRIVIKKGPKGPPAPPQALQAKYPDRLITSAVAYQLVGISRAEFYKRLEVGAYQFVKDEHDRKWFPSGQFGVPDNIVLDLLAKLQRPKKGELLAINETVKKERAERERLAQIATAPMAVEERRSVPPAAHAPSYTPEEASLVFTALDAGRTPVQIVCELKVMPRHVHELLGEYNKLKGTLVLSAEEREILSRLPWRALTLPLETGAQLITAAQASLGIIEPCGKCGQGRARICATCANKAGML